MSFIIVFIFFGKNNYAQNITLEDCYKLVNTNFPLIKQQVLLDTQNKLDLELLEIGKKPKIDLAAQATYQSDVIRIPIAGVTQPNKDQYRATISVNQLIYAGGLIDANKKVKQAELKSQQKQIEVSIYQLKKQINNLFFSILLLQDKKSLLTSKKTVLETKLKEVLSGIRNGVLIPTQDKILEVEILKIEQQFYEIKFNKQSLTNSLSSLIGKTLNSSTNFRTPASKETLLTKENRPELALFKFKKEQLDALDNVILKQKSPKIIGFATGGLGNPGLDPLDNSFQEFYTLGIKLNWNIFDWNAHKKQRNIIRIKKDIINSETAVFNLNTQIALQQQLFEIDKLKNNINADAKIITLRKTILKTVEAQLKNGIITASIYITELSNLFEAKNNLDTHKKQLLLAQANYNTTLGQ